MKRRVAFVLLMFALVFVLVACSQASKEKDDKEEKKTTNVEEDEMTMEEKLVKGYWYLNGFEFGNYFYQFEFKKDGTFEGTYLPRYTSEEKNGWECCGEWEYNSKRKELSLRILMDDVEQESILYYDETNGWFRIDYEMEDGVDLSAIPDGFEDYKKFYEDGINAYMLCLEDDYDVVNRELVNVLFSKIYGENDWADSFFKTPDLDAKVEKTRRQKDFSAIGELHHAISLTMAFIEEDVKVNPNPVKVNENGEIIIAELFDTSNNAGKDFATEVESILGDTITLSSQMKKDCTIQIVEFDTYSGVVVIQVISEVVDQEVYFDMSGQWTGIYE